MQRFEDSRQDAVFRPSIRATINTVPLAEIPGQFPPFASVFGDVKYGVEENGVFDFDVPPLNGKRVLDLLVLFRSEWFHPRTIRVCLKKYRDGGLDGVYRYDKHVPTSESESFSELIEDELAKNPPRSSAEAGDVIEKLTGIKRSPTQVRAFLKKKRSCV